jgi:hypothetical protein
MSAIRLASVIIGAAIGLVLGEAAALLFHYPGRLLEAGTMAAVFCAAVVVCYLVGSVAEWLGHRL